MICSQLNIHLNLPYYKSKTTNLSLNTYNNCIFDLILI